MLLVYVLLAAACGAVLFFARREEGTLLEKPGKWLYKTAVRLSGGAAGERSRRLEEELSLLEPEKDKRQAARREMEKLAGECFLLLSAGTFLALCLYLRDRMPQREDGTPFTVERGAYGSAEKTVELTASSGGREETVRLSVAPRHYSAEETRALFTEFLPALEQAVLGENPDAGQVSRPLALLEELEGFPFTVTWTGDSRGLIAPDGSLKQDDLPEQGCRTVLKAVIRYDTFQEEWELPLQICPPILTPAERFRQAAERLAREAEESGREQAQVILPDRLGEEAIEWKAVRRSDSFLLLLCAALGAGLLAAGRKEDRRRQLEKRQRSLKEAYPDLVTQMALLLGAGLTLRAAFQKITKEAGKGKEALTREMRIACYEMDNGISESQSYLHFGERCGSKEYRKLSVLLTQNLKKGSRGLLEQLEKEAREALEEKKSRARQYGEEAGTRLLAPMTGMLVITMLLILVPAFGGLGL